MKEENSSAQYPGLSCVILLQSAREPTLLFSFSLFFFYLLDVNSKRKYSLAFTIFSLFVSSDFPAEGSFFLVKILTSFWMRSLCGALQTLCPHFSSRSGFSEFTLMAFTF